MGGNPCNRTTEANVGRAERKPLMDADRRSWATKSFSLPAETRSTPRAFGEHAPRVPEAARLRRFPPQLRPHSSELSSLTRNLTIIHFA